VGIIVRLHGHECAQLQLSMKSAFHHHLLMAHQPVEGNRITPARKPSQENKAVEASALKRILTHGAPCPFFFLLFLNSRTTTAF
jgi:hypothetical protein